MVVKGFVLWTLFVVFLILTVTAVDMGEYTIAVVMGVIALVCAWAAPMGTRKKAKITRLQRELRVVRTERDELARVRQADVPDVTDERVPADG